MLIQPIFNQNSNRPYRWCLQIMKSGKLIDKYSILDDHYAHWVEKSVATPRDTYLISGQFINSDFLPMRTKNIGFLTTYHKEFYEDGKYVEVFNDPINYILKDSINYSTAFTDAEQRIGNYRIGVRRHIMHLGGTISQSELDMLKDSSGTPLTSFPLMPPLPPTSYLKPFRTRLITSDVGYIDYIKTANGAETTVTARYAYQAKQSTGFKSFIFNAGNSNMMYESTLINSISKVDIKDLETIVDAAISTATDSDSTTLLPTDGEYAIYNIAANTVIRMDATSGVSLEKWNGTTTLGTTLDAYINITAAGYIDITDINGNNITMDNTGIVITNGTRTITMNGSTVDIT